MDAQPTAVRFDMKVNLTVFIGGLAQQSRRAQLRRLEAKLGRSFGDGLVVERRRYEWIIQPLDDNGQPLMTGGEGELHPLLLSFPLQGRAVPVGITLSYDDDK